jgi:hypothetical protein
MRGEEREAGGWMQFAGRDFRGGGCEKGLSHQGDTAARCLPSGRRSFSIHLGAPASQKPAML